jgi:hypothetical protein
MSAGSVHAGLFDAEPLPPTHRLPPRRCRRARAGHGSYRPRHDDARDRLTPRLVAFDCCPQRGVRWSVQQILRVMNRTPEGDVAGDSSSRCLFPRRCPRRCPACMPCLRPTASTWALLRPPSASCCQAGGDGSRGHGGLHARQREAGGHNRKEARTRIAALSEAQHRSS